MKALLLTFGLSLLAALRGQAFPTVDETQNVSGTWYLKATAWDKEIPDKRLGSVPVTPMNIKTLEGGNLEVKFTVLIAGRCQEITTLLEKTDEPGKYTAYVGMRVLLFIIPSAVEDHYIFYYEGKVFKHRIRVAKLLGRDPEINQEALEDFQNAVRAGGLNPDNIFIPKQSETCPLGSD